MVIAILSNALKITAATPITMRLLRHVQFTTMMLALFVV